MESDKRRVLRQLGERVFCAPGGENIGVVKTGLRSAIMIDSGLNDSAARKVIRELEAERRQVSAVITTHGHADHFGANAWIVRRTGAKVWAPSWDETLLRHPLFQPLSLYAGADPPASLRGSFLLADPSPVDVVFDSGELEIDGATFRAVPLAGHSGNQMGILVDGVFFCSDVVFPKAVIERYRMPYLYSVRYHLESLDRAASVDHTAAVPGHGAICENIGPGVEFNRNLVLDIADAIVRLCDEPLMPEEILGRLLTDLGAEPANPASYYLLHPTIFAYLTYLEEIGRMKHEISSARSLWTAV